MAMAEIEQGLAELQRNMAAQRINLDNCAALLTDLKIALTKLPGFSIVSAAPPAEFLKDIVLARDVYELGTLLSIRQEDDALFERHVAQCKTYYLDYAGIIENSARQNLIMALNLMRLLAQNRIAEFHTELELIPVEVRSDPYVRYVLGLEQFLMEGSYAKIASAGLEPPDPSFAFFTSVLMGTVRDEIASCSEKAYKQITIPVARNILSLSSDGDVLAIAEDRNWIIRDGMIHFDEIKVQAPSMEQVPSMELIKRTLHYAKELEQIV